MIDNLIWAPGKTGRLPAKIGPRALHLARLAPRLTEKPPAKTNFWANRASFDIRDFGNLDYGDCTRAKQAHAAMRMERIEIRRTPSISDEEVIRVYTEMAERLYGGGDTGAYETDALDCWRRPEYTFRDTKGRPLTIDAYLKVNQSDQLEFRSAMVAAGAHGVAVCLNLPMGFIDIQPPKDWDFPDDTPLTGMWVPGSWGGHSMWARDYDEIGVWLVHTWKIPDQRITWRAFGAYCDEAYVIIDSIDYWRKKKTIASKAIDLNAVKKAVNAVSSFKIA